MSMDTKVKGLVIKCRDYKESDKMMTILSAEQGKIYVVGKGTKKQSSKLKGFCQNFCFADFELQEGKSGLILTGAQPIDYFFELSQDYSKYTYACAILEILDKICRENISYAPLLIDTLKCLQAINYHDLQPSTVLCKFILCLLQFEGLNFNTSSCNRCRSPFLSEAYLDVYTSDLLCPVCRNADNLVVDKAVMSTIKILSDIDFDRLSTVKTSNTILLRAIRLLTSYLSEKYEIVFNYVNLIA